MNRFILTEDERRNISNLHKNYITEQVATDNVIQPGVFNQKVQDLQNHLIKTFGSKIVADGKLGPKTLGAAQAAYLSKTKQPTTVPPVASSTVPPVASSTVPPVASSTVAPAAATTVASPLQYGGIDGLDSNDDMINKYN
jgi:hypothetical protein